MRLIDGCGVAFNVTAAVAVTSEPEGGVPTTDAEFVSDPASTSVCFAVYVN